MSHRADAEQLELRIHFVCLLWNCKWISRTPRRARPDKLNLLDSREVFGKLLRAWLDIGRGRSAGVPESWKPLPINRETKLCPAVESGVLRNKLPCRRWRDELKGFRNTSPSENWVINKVILLRRIFRNKCRINLKLEWYRKWVNDWQPRQDGNAERLFEEFLWEGFPWC